MSNPQQKKVNVKIDEKVGEGIYANFVGITHNPSEFILDFGRMLPGLPDARIYSRIIATPQHAKRFLKVLQQNIDIYENNLGEIRLPGEQEEPQIGFRQPDKQ